MFHTQKLLLITATAWALSGCGGGQQDAAVAPDHSRPLATSQTPTNVTTPLQSANVEAEVQPGIRSRESHEQHESHKHLMPAGVRSAYTPLVSS